MSGRTTVSGIVPQTNSVKLAGEESKDKLYEPKHSKKLVRVLTVVAYMFSVSLAAIMLSMYYVFLWNPRDATRQQSPPQKDCVPSGVVVPQVPTFPTTLRANVTGPGNSSTSE